MARLVIRVVCSPQVLQSKSSELPPPPARITWTPMDAHRSATTRSFSTLSPAPPFLSAGPRAQSSWFPGTKKTCQKLRCSSSSVCLRSPSAVRGQKSLFFLLTTPVSPISFPPESVDAVADVTGDDQHPLDPQQLLCCQHSIWPIGREPCSCSREVLHPSQIRRIVGVEVADGVDLEQRLEIMLPCTHGTPGRHPRLPRRRPLVNIKHFDASKPKTHLKMHYIILN